VLGASAGFVLGASAGADGRRALLTQRTTVSISQGIVGVLM